MNYKFKLSQRMARIRALATLLLCGVSAACERDLSAPGTDAAPATRLNLSPESVSLDTSETIQFAVSFDSAAPDVLVLSGYRKGKPNRRIVSLTVTPETTTLGVRGSSALLATARLSDGTVVMPVVRWSATGGTIDSNGVYIAGSVSGIYSAIAATKNGVADTAQITVTSTPITPVQLTLNPASTTLPEGTSALFKAQARAQDGSILGTSPKFTATGGTVTSTGVYTAGMRTGIFLVIAADTASGLSDTSTVIITPPDATILSIALTPSQASLQIGATRQFTVTARMSDSTTSSVVAGFTASGGTVTSGGLFTAGQTPGTYRVIATTAGGLADTATIQVTAPAATLQQVVLSPSSASLPSGGVQQFAARGTMSDGSSAPIAARFAATGGTVTGSGLYTAGGTPGTYRVVATDSATGKADTAAITITSPPSPLPTNPSCQRTVNVSSVSALTGAVGNALPGDCIQLAAGTYSLTTKIIISASGTATNPITIEGTGSNTIINFNRTAGQTIFVDGAYIQLRKFRLTNLSTMGLWFRASHHNLVDSLEIDHTGQEAIRLYTDAHHNTIQYSKFHDTGEINATYAEGIYVGPGSAGCPTGTGNKGNVIQYNTFGPNIRSENIDVKQCTDSTTIRGNHFDGTGVRWTADYNVSGLITVQGSHTLIEDNTFYRGAPHGIHYYYNSTTPGTGSLVQGNSFDLYNSTISGFTGIARGIYRDLSFPGVVAKCDNTFSNLSGVNFTGTAYANITCIP